LFAIEKTNAVTAVCAIWSMKMMVKDYEDDVAMHQQQANSFLSSQSHPATKNSHSSCKQLESV
jgi:hypothetical protein